MLLEDFTSATALATATAFARASGETLLLSDIGWFDLPESSEGFSVGFGSVGGCFSGGVIPDEAGEDDANDLFFAALAASRFLVDGDLCLPDALDPVEVLEVFISGGLTEPEVLVAVALGRQPEPDALELVAVALGR